MTEKKILLVEDDLNLGFLLMDYLETEDMKVKLCKDGRSGLDTLSKQHFDLCLFDIMLPELDGYTLAKTMRSMGVETPFLFLTAKSMKEDKLKAYGLGAEDFITKPFDEEELLCKINVILRRYSDDPYANSPCQFQLGNYYFDYKRQELGFGKKMHKLTEKENEILRLLCIHKNEVLRREDAVEYIYGKKDYFLGRSFDVYISRIRKLLAQDENVQIQNVYKVGFILDLPN